MFLPPGRLQVAIEQECAIGAGTMQVFPDRDTKRFGFSGGSGIFPFVIAAAQVFLQPQIEADEEVPATHLLDFQLGLTRSAVAPGNGNRGPRISADDRFERKLDREIEMRREHRHAALDHGAPIRLEGIRGVVERNAKKHPDKQISESVQPQLDPGIINYATAFQKAGAENSIPSLV